MNNEQEIVSRLKFIGKLKKGEKINTHHMYVEPEGIITLLKRTFWNNDNRNNALAFIQDTIARGFDLLRNHKHSDKESNKILANNIIKDLKSAATGLLNIKSTYINDTKFCCDIDTILEYITARLSQFDENNESCEIIIEEDD